MSRETTSRVGAPHLWLRGEAPLSFKVMRFVLALAVKAFYNTIEISNSHWLADSDENEAVILCANHGNSLTDAIMVIISTSSHFVRLTAKDTVFKSRFFGAVVRAVGTIPIQRRTEHGDNADNTQSMAALHKALGEGGCVCLFPEGISRYMSGLATLRSGTGRIALELLKSKLDEGHTDFTVTLAPMGITYLQREKFRSDVGVSFAEPIRLKPEDYTRLLAEHGSEYEAAKHIMDRVQKGLLGKCVSGVDWDAVNAAITARSLYAPLGTSITLTQHVQLTGSFARYLSVLPTKERERRLLTRSPSSPDMSYSEAKSEEESNEVLKVKTDLLHYSDGLDRVGLSDEAVRQGEQALLYIALSFLWASFLLSIALPGLLFMSPVFILGKVAELRATRLTHATPAEIANIVDEIPALACDVFHALTAPALRLLRALTNCLHLDEIAQFKLAVGVLVMPWVHFAAVVCVCRSTGISALPCALLVVPLWLWASLRWLEDGFASLKAAHDFFRARRVAHTALPEMAKIREELVRQVRSLAEKRGLPSLEALLKEKEERAPSGLLSRLAYFSLKRRHKARWGEVMRLANQHPDYPVQVIRKQEERRRRKEGGPSAHPGAIHVTLTS